MKKELKSIVLTVLVLFLLGYPLVKMTGNLLALIEKSKTPVEVGVVYLHSYAWGDQDPFTEKRVEKVKVIDKQQGFVKYHFLSDTTFTLSTTVKAFRSTIKPLDYDVK
jgi:hypothetical protein